MKSFETSITSKMFSNITEDLAIVGYINTLQSIREDLVESGISFEGKDVPISFSPTVLCNSEIEILIPKMRYIKLALEKIIRCFVHEHHNNENGHLHQFFSPYK